jgi:serine phosphatase RsbU (regulator of sigma subunit)
LNPFTGREEASVRRTAGEITSDTAENMVRVLAKTPAANDGSQIMAHQELLRIVGQMKALAAGADPGTVSVERPPSQPRDLRRNTGVISRQDFQVRIARTRSQATVQVPTTRNHRRMGTATVTPAKLEQEHLRRATPIGLDVASVRQPTPARSDPLRDDLVRAARAQRQLLSNPPSCEGVDLGLYFCPKDQVGGDFYEVVKRPDGSLFIALGDVSGHGVQGAVVAAGAVKTLRFLARESGSLADLVTRFNDECRSDLVTGQFVTLFAAEFHPEDKRIEFLLAGHHLLLICNISAENMVRRVGKPGMALGLADGETFRSRVETLTLELTPGDVLLQFSDALVEARNAGGEAFGLARTCAAALRHQHHSANEMAEWIADEVFQWSGGNPDDDLTVLTAALR